MFIALDPPPDPESMRALVIVLVIVAVIFWRIALKVLLMGAIVLIVVGAFEAVSGLH